MSPIAIVRRRVIVGFIVVATVIGCGYQILIAALGNAQCRRLSMMVEEWRMKAADEIQGQVTRDQAAQWLRSNGFRTFKGDSMRWTPAGEERTFNVWGERLLEEQGIGTAAAWVHVSFRFEHDGTFRDHLVEVSRLAVPASLQLEP